MVAAERVWLPTGEEAGRSDDEGWVPTSAS